MIKNSKELSLKKITLQADDKAKIIKIEKMMNYLRLKQSFASGGEKKGGVHGNS